MIEGKGVICDYADVKSDNWSISHEIDFVVVAGGDGTVKKTLKKLLERRLIDKRFPMAILPLGTANNLSRSLNLELNTEKAITRWLKPKLKKFDVGRIYGIAKHDFFLEGMGYGIFPCLIHKMKTADKSLSDDPEKRLEAALKTIKKIIPEYKPVYAHVVIDGKDHSGEYLMIEIMNIPSIGPNLMLAPDADISDGLFEIILVPESKRKKLASYVENKLKGKETPVNLNIIKGRKIYIKWEGTDGHIDDKLIRIKEHPELKIENHQGLLEFLN